MEKQEQREKEAEDAMPVEFVEHCFRFRRELNMNGLMLAV